jgi:hypothetical protein
VETGLGNIAAAGLDTLPGRRRTLHPDQRSLPLAELADVDHVYGYSFIVMNWT